MNLRQINQIKCHIIHQLLHLDISLRTGLSCEHSDSEDISYLIPGLIVTLIMLTYIQLFCSTDHTCRDQSENVWWLLLTILLHFFWIYQQIISISTQFSWSLTTASLHNSTKQMFTFNKPDHWSKNISVQKIYIWAINREEFH